MSHTMKTFLTRIVWILLLLMSVFSTSISFAYYYNGIVSGSDDNSLGTLSIGAWTQAPEGIDAYDPATGYNSGDLVWFEGDFWIYKGNYSYGVTPSIADGWTYLNDLNWYSTIIYQANEVVYYNGIVFQTTGYTVGDEPTLGAPWVSKMNNQVQWITGQAVTLNEIVYYNGSLWMYHDYYTTTEPGSNDGWGLVGDLTYSSGFVYNTGDVTLYNGTYYIATGYAKNKRPDKKNSPFSALTVPAWSSSIPSGTTHVSYGGLLYEALTTNITTLQTTTPGSSASYGVWHAIDTQEWQQYNTYVTNDLVMYNGSVFMLDNASNSTVVPGTAGNSWDLMNNMEYDPFSTYSVGEFAVVNGIVYEVVNATNANAYAPEVVADSWNRLSGYEWYWFNNYEVGDILYHNDGVYIALAASTNIEPGVSGSESYWGLYNEN
eukprot:Anaeramoba_ignava/c8415_g1_i1.p1 GENE.c8415_g1_i1~~c8415_g1_i1.p1  ORF type:complete len:432 (-),score=6.14 c8415_g1_i1:720-2015(-)